MSSSQHQKAAKKQQRTRMTNKSIEARQFSSVRVPRSSELPPQQPANVEALYAEQRGQGVRGGAATTSATAAATTVSSSSAFDPIPNDAMFFIVENSKYWPPPSLEELQRTSGISVAGTDGFDTYDRAADDQKAKKEKTKVVKGELNHPRGKPRKNVIVKLTDSDEDKEEEENAE